MSGNTDLSGSTALSNSEENARYDIPLTTQKSTDSSEQNQNQFDKLLGTTRISERRHENGRIYRIELEHSSGSKQVIEEFDSDGKIQSTSNDIEETPNLPKWRLGSW